MQPVELLQHVCVKERERDREISKDVNTHLNKRKHPVSKRLFSN